MIWTAGVTNWLEWYYYVRESGSWYDSKCPEYIQDSPEMYNSWLQTQKQIEQNKSKTAYRRN